MILVAAILGLVFATLAGLHAYWGCGGRWGAAAAAPKKPDGTSFFHPSAVACFVVAAGLAAFAWVCLAHAAIVPAFLLTGRTKVVLLGLSGIFALRTIGDFKYVGLFRRVGPTDFSRMDKILYTPLCFVVSGLLFWLATGK